MEVKINSPGGNGISFFFRPCLGYGPVSLREPVVEGMFFFFTASNRALYNSKNGKYGFYLISSLGFLFAVLNRI